MLETLKARKEQLEAQGKKGFTLMEMLIVIAIIAVLVAIAIPVFTAQLDNARAQTDAANIRGGYATATAKILQDNVATTKTYYLNSDGTVTESASGSYQCQGNGNEKIGGSTVNWTKDQHISYVYTPSAAATPGEGGSGGTAAVEAKIEIRPVS